MRDDKFLFLILLVTLCTPGFSYSQGGTIEQGTATPDAEVDLAKKLANPIANLISVPFQYNYDENFGVGDEGSKSVLNIQPVAPFSLNDEWNVITRTIIPLVDTDDVPVGSSEFGLGDIVASQFFSPKKPTERGWIWGIGPVELLPTAFDEALGAEKWGLGPTGVVLQQKGPWTVGLLANHIWSFAGNDDRDDISATFLQPFLTYVTKTKTTFSVNTESTYDWENDDWAVPLNFNVSQLLKVGDQILSIGAGVRYWTESPENGPEDWGGRLVLTLLFPQ
ncbi:MAG: hypothetical protein WBB19_12015 [Desulforhopalus sp.]